MLKSNSIPIINELGINVDTTSSPSAQEIVREHTTMLYKGARSMGFSTIDTEELVQEVWVTYFSRQDHFEGRSKLSTFLYGILVNKCKERWRHQGKTITASPESFDSLFESHFNQRGHWNKRPCSPEKFSEAVSNIEALEKCLEKIPPMQKAAYTLRDVREFEVSQVMESLKISSSNVHVLLFRARAALRECLEREFMVKAQGR